MVKVDIPHHCWYEDKPLTLTFPDEWKVHKLKVALKELRESEVWLKIIARAGMVRAADSVAAALKETDELISILFRSVDTAKKNMAKQ